MGHQHLINDLRRVRERAKGMVHRGRPGGETGREAEQGRSGPCRQSDPEGKEVRVGRKGGKTLGTEVLWVISATAPRNRRPSLDRLLCCTNTLGPSNRRFQTRSFGKINAAAVFRVFRQLPGNTYVFTFLLTPSNQIVGKSRKNSHAPNISE